MNVTRCSDASRAAGESLSATATTAEHWLLLEARGAWPRDVNEPGMLPGAARDVVAGWLEATPRSRLLFVRRPSRATGSHLAFVVHAPEAGGTVRRLELDTLADLAGVDPDRDGEVTESPLVLVCGHGSRDACCALRGTAVFVALARERAGEEVWLSSHQGGHRFAANVVVLPAAVQLGRVEPDDAPRVVDGVLRGRIDLELYRGRTCHDPVVQAADHALRASAGVDAIGDVRLLGVVGSTVRLLGPGGIEHVVEVSEVSGPAVPASCGEAPGPQLVRSGRLVTA